MVSAVCGSCHLIAPNLWATPPESRHNRATFIEAGKEMMQEDSKNLEALLIQELGRLHEGVLARYGLRPSELLKWKEAQKN